MSWGSCSRREGNEDALVEVFDEPVTVDDGTGRSDRIEMGFRCDLIRCSTSSLLRSTAVAAEGVGPTVTRRGVEEIGDLDVCSAHGSLLLLSTEATRGQMDVASLVGR